MRANLPRRSGGAKKGQESRSFVGRSERTDVDSEAEVSVGPFRPGTMVCRRRSDAAPTFPPSTSPLLAPARPSRYPCPMRSSTLVFLVSLGPLFFTACGVSDGSHPGADSGPPTDATVPGIDPNNDTSTLTNAQLGGPCDWAMGELGGYGKVTQCGPFGTQPMTVTNPANQAMCVATAFIFRCSVTIGEYEGCVRSQAPSGGCRNSLRHAGADDPTRVNFSWGRSRSPSCHHKQSK